MSQFRKVTWKPFYHLTWNDAYVKNHDKFKSIGTHWIPLYTNTENVTYFDSFEVEHTPKENVKTNIYRIQAYDSIMHGYFLLDLLISC